VSGIKTLSRQSSWLLEQAYPLPSHDVPGYFHMVVWRLRNFGATNFPLRHFVGNRVGEQFAIDMCALMHEEKREWLGMQENH